MAPDSRFWGHQLGEATTRLQQTVLKATVPVCLFLSLSTPITQVEARTTEPMRDSWSELSAPFMGHERAFHGDSLGLTALIPPASLLNTSPAGLWSDRIQIHIPNLPVVQKYVDFYQGRGRRTIEEALDRSGPYVSIMSEILEYYGVPAELLSVVIVESCFKRHASYRGAGGYWQLLSSTARSMGLRVDQWVDERRDPIKSTQAAAKYLYSFYKKYNSWPLALAAYNAGGGPVDKAIDRVGTSDFWELSRRGMLPTITRAYVPKVYATIQLLRNLKEYGFERPEFSSLYDFESLRVRAPLKLEQVARWIDVPTSRLRDINPSLCLDRLPPDGSVSLNLPSGSRDKFDLAYEDYLRR